MLKKSLTIFEGGLIGLVVGTVFGIGLGWMADLILEPTYGYWRLWGGILGILAGLVSGLGISVLGIGTRYCLEWVLINGIAVPFGFFLISRDWNWNNWKFILTISTFGAITGWLTVLLIRSILSNRIPRRTFHYWIIMAYLVIFAVLSYTSPRLLQMVALAISP